MKTVIIDSLPINAQLQSVLSKINVSKLPNVGPITRVENYRKIQMGDTIYLVKNSLVYREEKNDQSLNWDSGLA